MSNALVLSIQRKDAQCRSKPALFGTHLTMNASLAVFIIDLTRGESRNMGCAPTMMLGTIIFSVVECARLGRQ
jgi:hypothetical protein